MRKSGLTRWSLAVLASVAGHILLLGNAGTPPSGATPSAAMTVSVHVAAPKPRETADKSAVAATADTPTPKKPEPKVTADLPPQKAAPVPPKKVVTKDPPKTEPAKKRPPVKTATKPAPKRQKAEKKPKPAARTAPPKPKLQKPVVRQKKVAKPRKKVRPKPVARPKLKKVSKPKRVAKPKRATPKKSARKAKRLKHTAKRRTATIKGRTKDLRRKSQQLALRKSANDGDGGKIAIMRRIRLMGSPRPAHYPRLSVEREEQGTVIVRALVSRTGHPTLVKVWRSSGFPRLDQSAIAAVRGWRFVPAHRNGANVRAWVQVPVRFRLD